MDKRASLTPESVNVIVNKGTEYPGTGIYNTLQERGTYLCRACGIALFRASDKFLSSCGWPSFDDEIAGRIKRLPDPDGKRTEIICNRCQGHLGHVFQGEGLTGKNLRYCVNSLSIDFVTDTCVQETEEAILAAGCFWGVEYYFQKLAGVLKTEVGYTGGHRDYPNYSAVCNEDSGHVEAVRIVYDPSKVAYREILKYFFEIHDPTQANGQGNDIGSQYLSKIFCYDKVQQQTAEEVIKLLYNKGYQVATQVLPVSVFWPAEENHQAYYRKRGGEPYCHFFCPRF